MTETWREIILTTLFSLGVLSLVIGLCLLLLPQTFIRATNRLNRWISTDAVFDSLDRPRPADRYLYRNHVVLGLLVTAGAFYILFMFFVWYDRAVIMPRLPVIYNPAASAWVYDSLVLLLRGVGVVGVVAGIVIAVRPSRLKQLEGWANRWVATDRWFKSLDRQKQLPQEWFPGRPRLFGALIALGSLYIVLQCGRILFPQF